MTAPSHKLAGRVAAQPVPVGRAPDAMALARMGRLLVQHQPAVPVAAIPAQIVKVRVLQQVQVQLRLAEQEAKAVAAEVALPVDRRPTIRCMW